MNANELADFIDGNVAPFLNDHQEYLDKATALLRQQQAEIEALKQSKFEANNKVNLTDEEIWDFINALCLDMGDYWELTEKNAIPMIRAILRKAQEK